MASAAQAKYVIKLEDKTKRAFKAIGKSLKRTTSAVFSMKTGFISAAGIAGIGYFVKKSLDATDEMAKMSRAIGVSVEELQRLRHAASLGGLEATQLDKAVQKLAVNMADMSKGVGLAKDVFKKYNIEVENQDGSLRSVVDVMADVADVTAGLTNKTEKADIAYKLFGARGAKMINVLEGGSAAMREAMLEADKLGLVMTAETAQGVEKANDAFTRLGSYLTSAFHRAVAKLAPLLKSITDSIREWVEMKIDKAGGVGKVATQMARTVLAAIRAMLEGFQKLGNGLIGLGKQIAQFAGLAARPIDIVKDKIKEMEGFIKTSKKHIAEGGVFKNPFGWTEDTLEKQKNKLKELKEELELSKKSIINIKPINFSSWYKALDDLSLGLTDVVTGHPEIFGGEAGGSKTMKKQKTIWDQMKDGFKDYKKTVEKGSLNIASITEKTMKSTEDAIVNMIMGVKVDFRKMANSIAADLVRMQVQRNITKPLDKFISGVNWGDLFSFAGGGFTGQGSRSGGIDGQGGFPAILHPNETVIDHNNGGGGQVINVTYSPQINALDPRTAATVIAQNAPTIVSVVRQAFNRNGQAVAI